MANKKSKIGAGAPRLVINNWLDAARRSTRTHFDPYMLWSLQTGLRQFPRGNAPGILPDLEFVAGLFAPFDPALPSHWPSVPVHARPWVPKVYGDPLPGGTSTARYVTIRVHTQNATLKEIETCVIALTKVPQIQRLQIGFPRPGLATQVVPVRGPKPIVWNGPGPLAVVLGVMDDACPFGHLALASAPGRTRVAALWDQSLGPAKPFTPPDGFAYGTQIVQTQLDDLIAKYVDAGHLDEEALYADVAAHQPLLFTRVSHATSVATLMAGNPDCIPTHRNAAGAGLPQEDSSCLPAGNCAGPPAAQAALVAVQFPREQVDLTGGRWLAVQALDGLRYLADASRQLAPQGRRPLPLVTNISYGGVVGAHDGTAMLESAMDELSKAHGELAIVLAAGNACGTTRDQEAVDALDYLASGAHARQAIAPGATAQLRLRVPPGKNFETYLEMWFSRPEAAHDDPQFLNDGDVQITAISPLGLPLALTRCPDIQFDGKSPKTTTAGLLLFPRVSQSLLRSMALLVIAATQISSTRVSSASGIWSISVSNQSAQPLILDAWVERDIVPGASYGGQAARLMPDVDGQPDGLSDLDTLNNIGTGKHVLRAGSLTALMDAQDRPVISPYSSAARSVSVGPEFSAVADEGGVSRGIRVSGSLSSSVVRMNGTSLAAPQAARWVAEQLASGISLAQLRAQLAKMSSADPRRGRICL